VKSIKRTAALTLGLALALAFSGCAGNAAPKAAAASGPFKPGTYRTEAHGNNGTVVVETTLDAVSIKAIRILDQGETPGIGDAAFELMPGRIVAAQSLELDAVSGASNSSHAILEAVGAALALAGGSAADLRPAAAADDSAGTLSDAETEVVVVGAGGSGMAAALDAAAMGLKVILIEKMPMVGGTTARASTAFNAGGSSVQMSLQKPYTADDYYKKLLGSSKVDIPSLRRMADLSGPAADWLIRMGADLSKVINGSQHIPSDGRAFGGMVVSALKKQLASQGIDCRVETEGKRLIAQDGKVVGIEVVTPKGAYKILARAVILATGGFASNPAMVDRYTPQWSGCPSTASPGSTGDGLRMAMEVGAAVDDMARTGPQTVAFDTGRGAVSLTNARYNGAILVNKEGKRFVNELAGTEILGKTIMAQTGGVAYLVFDQASVDRAALMEDYKKHGYFTEAATLEQLGAKLAIDGGELEKSVEKYRTFIDAGKDAEFGRKDSLFSRIDKPVYYGAKISPANQTTYGGVKIDLDTRALREDGSVIPGLYVSGEAASQFGQGVTIAVVLGKLAAATVAADLKR